MSNKTNYIIADNVENLDVEIFTSDIAAINEAKELVQEDFDGVYDETYTYTVYKLVPVAVVSGKVKQEINVKRI